MRAFTRKNRVFLLAFVLFILFLFLCPVQNIKKVDVLNTFAPPSADHWLGTDHLGRDTFSLLIAGGFRTLLVVFLSTGISFLGGISLGMLEGTKGGTISSIIRFAADFSLIMPSFIMALVFSALFGFSPLMIAIVLGIGNMGEYINQVCSLTRVLCKRDFISAERVVGISETMLLFFHILPNISAQMLVFMGNKAGSMVIQYSGLTFIGLGAEITNPDWGTLLYQYRSYMIPHPELVIYPILLICFLTVVFHEMFDSGEEYRVSGRKRIRSFLKKTYGGNPEKSDADEYLPEVPERSADTVCEADAGIPPVLLKTEGLSLTIHGKQKDIPVLKNLNMVIRQGERWGIIGESGAGKSMTLQTIAAFQKAVDYSVSGRILYRDQDGFFDLFSVDRMEQRSYASHKVSMILQDSINALNPFEKIRKQWEETIHLHHPSMDKEELYVHMLHQMERFSVDGGEQILNKYPYQLSGGQKQRIAIAMSLESKAEILLADEPTTSLDSISQRKVIQYLAEICVKNGFTMLFVSHNLGIVRELCTHAAVMKEGVIVEQGSVEEVFRNPKHAYTQYILEETRKLEAGKDRQCTK